MSGDRTDLEQAILYALKQGCFFPVPAPKPPYRTQDLIQWGAMRNLHRAIAERFRGETGRER